MFEFTHQKTWTVVKSPKSHWILKGVLGLAAILIFWLGRKHFFELITIIGNREIISAYLEGYGIWGAALLLFLLNVQVISAVIPGQILLITSGYLYGFGGGLALNLLGTVVASQIAFVVARWAGRPLIERLVPAKTLNHWRQVSERQGLTFFLLFFWFPVIPSNIMNLVAGISSISFRSFLVASFLGRLPGLIFITLIGAYGIQLSLQQWGVLAVVALVLLVSGRLATTKIQRRYFAS